MTYSTGSHHGAGDAGPPALPAAASGDAGAAADNAGHSDTSPLLATGAPAASEGHSQGALHETQLPAPDCTPRPLATTSSNAQIGPGEQWQPTCAVPPPSAESFLCDPSGSSATPGLPPPSLSFPLLGAQGYAVQGVPLPEANYPPMPAIFGLPFPPPTTGQPLHPPGLPCLPPTPGFPPFTSLPPANGTARFPPRSFPMMAPPPPPAGTRVRTLLHGDTVEIVIPPAGCSSGPTSFKAATMLVFACIWLLITFMWITNAAQTDAPLVLMAFSLPFLFAGAAILFMAVRGLLLQERILISPEYFLITKQLLDWGSQVQGHRADVAYVDLTITGYTNGQPVLTAVIAEGVREHRVGDNLMPVEQQWLVSELARFLGVRVGAIPHNAAPFFQAVPPAMVVNL